MKQGLDTELSKKLCRNSLVLEQITKLTPEEKQKAIQLLLAGKTERQLVKEIGVPLGTIHSWKTLNYLEKDKAYCISIDRIIEKFENYKPRLAEFEKLQRLRAIIDKILMLDYK